MSEKITLNKPIKHIAFIMDGNGRWAKERNLPRHKGHKEAMNRIIEVFDFCQEFDIHIMSFYAFSTENWKRPKSEIDHLFRYLEIFFRKEIKRLIRDGTRVMISGDTTRLPKKTQETIAKSIELTKDCKNHVFNICLNYGGKEEITKATREIAQEVKEGKLKLDDINEQTVENHLYTKGLPNVDLLIRTSGEVRISNFLPWQLCYAEMIFTPVKWPDFKHDAFVDCMKEYNNRNRRFGGLDNEKD